MYASRTTCSRCASQLRSAQATRLGGGAAWFASLTDAADSSHQAVGTAQGNEKANSRSGSKEGGGKANLKQFPQKPGSFSRKKPSRSSEESAVALFNDVVKPASRGKSATALQQQSSPLGELEIAAKMKYLAQRNINANEKFNIFKTDIWPHLKELRGQMPKHLFISTTQFLSKTCDEFAEHGCNGSAVEMLQMLSSVGKLDLDLRNQLVLNICHTLAQEKNTSRGRVALVRELIDLWKHISQLRRKSQEGAALQFAMSSVDEVLRDIGRSGNADGQRSFGMAPESRALAAIFLQFRPEQARDLLPGLLATVAVLSDPRLTRPNMQTPMAPLLNLVAAALGKQMATDAYVSTVFDERIRFHPSKISELKSYVINQWPTAITMLSKEDAPWRRGLSSPGQPSSSNSRSSAILHKQLIKAYHARNTGAIVSMWQDLKTRLEQQPGLARQMRDETEFLDYWIFVWCAVRRPGKVQETLDLMQQLQVHPSVKTYTAMMHGWKMCKDVERIEALWDKMVSSGVKLDVVIWTERISGLIEAGKPQVGIQALAQMLGLWKQAVQKGTQSTAVQPTIEVVNAAFKGLIRLDRKAAYDVLEWAGREEIEPNIRTYNILLRESFRGDMPEDVQDLLKAMKKQGIDPDAATFTIILEEVLGTMSNASAAEQVQAVQQVFADIEAAGLRPNAETYGKMLYAVSSLANGADEAIVAVQQHMQDNDVSATPHIVTILIERALSRDPPDITAVTNLLRDHNLTHVGQGDQTLWERVMSAHAITGGTAQAMAVFNDLARAGRPVTSLPCLTDLLKALLAAGQMEDARNVVGVVLGYKTKAREEPRDERYWRHHFWYLAKENGLLDGGDVPSKLQNRAKGWMDE